MNNRNDYLKKLKKVKIKIIVAQISILVCFFLIWELLGKKGLINTFLFSYPSYIGKLFVDYLIDGTLFKHIGISVAETMLGLLIGMGVGLLIAIIIWWNETFSRIIDPYLVVLNALPKTALAPIIIIWVGAGMKGIVCVAISISLVLTIMSASQYFKNVDLEKILMLKSLGATKFQILTKLIIPANILNLISLVKINIGMSWVGVIVGEFIISKEGIGYLIMYGSQIFKMSLVMMGVLVLSVLSFLMYEVVNIIELIGRKNEKK